jgi:hypothetical protein
MEKSGHQLETQEVPAHEDQFVDAHLIHPHFINQHAKNVSLIAVGTCFTAHGGVDARFSLLNYKVGPYMNVGCLWPKGWKPPGPNKNGWLPKFEFAKDPAANDPRDQYDHDIIFTYTTLDGKEYTPPFAFNPSKASKEEKEKKENQ